MKRGLGKGLDALFSIYNEDEESASVQETTGGVEEIDMRLIDPNKDQPRKKFDPASLKELSESIKLHGVIQPIILIRNGQNRYTIIAGERRFRASLIAGLKTIPAIVRDYTPREVKEVSLIENLQREDLNPIEAGRAIKQLMEEYALTQENIADRIGKSRPLVANTLRLLTLSPEVIKLIENGSISAGHGKVLVGLSPEDQSYIAKVIMEKKLTVREVENFVHDFQNPKEKKEKPVIYQSAELKELGHRMSRLFSTKVSIKGNDKKGKISIDYYSTDDLDRISAFLRKLER